jgi:RHS repeat-associated protein
MNTFNTQFAPRFSWVRGLFVSVIASKQKMLPFVFVVISITASAQYVSLPAQSSANASSRTVIRKEGVTESTALSSLPANELSQVVTYSDGFGRAFQSIGVGQSPTGGDMIMPGAFSKNGLVDTTYLPYVSATATGTIRVNALRGTVSDPNTYSTSEQYLFYQNTPKVAADNFPFSRTVYRNTPDAKVTEQGAPGQDWQPGGHTVRSTMTFNNATTYRVRYWKHDGTTNSDYPDNSVAVSIVTDENDNIVRSYTNALGQTVLKQVQVGSSSFLETYYIYDRYGRLTYEVPPKALETLGTGATLNANDGSVSELIFKYTYDNFNRVITRKVPGAAEEHMVYDKYDRLVLSQNGVLRAQNKWLFIKYDRQNRPIYTGVLADASSRATLQSTMDAIDYTTSPFFEVEQSGTSYHGYSNTVYPTTNTALLSVNYYDHYNFDRTGAVDYNYDNTHFAGQETNALANTRGLTTGSRTAIIDASGNISADWLIGVVFYDKYGRVIQTQSNNHLYLTVADKGTVIYDFEKALKSKATHYQSASSVVTTVTRNVYDDDGRLQRIYHSVNGAAEKAVVAYGYNALGQRVEKNLHCATCREDHDPQAGQSGVPYANTIERNSYSTGETKIVAKTSIRLLPTTPGFHVPTGSTFVAKIGQNTADYEAQFTNGANYLQSVDYRYNIRGWVTSINNAQLVVDGTNDDANDFFGMELAYNTAAGMSNTPYYNGNVSAVKWKGFGAASGSADQRSYKYTYDKSDRLTSSEFQANTGAGWTQEANTLNETMAYDVNGNITSLTRNSNNRGFAIVNSLPTVTSASQAMDNLVYTYTSGNQLSKVEDSGLASGFSNGTVNGTNEYTYDVDGSVIKDDNKDIDSVAYNILGKPRRIKFGNGNVVQYTYSAGGTKLKMSVTKSGVTNHTDYSGSFVYENSALSFFSSPEGRVVKNGSAFDYQYGISDQQGNTRVLFSATPPPPQPKSTTFEEVSNSDFSNYPSGANHSPMPLFNHTPVGGTYSQKLNGSGSSRIGVAKSYAVYPGDKLKIEAYAKYANPTSNSSNLGAFASALLGAYSLAAPAPGEVGTPSAALDLWGSTVASGYGPGNNNYPKAFVTILLFDKNYKFLDIAYEQIDGGAEDGSDVEHDYMMREYTVKEAGYAYVYCSNESPTQVDVYFDDVVMTYTPTNIIQYNEYYPFGLQTANSWTRENVTGNNFLANGATELNATTGLYDLDFRNYDPVLGRMNGVDPMAAKYSGLSPYNYSFNNPAVFNDPTGADPPPNHNTYFYGGYYTYDDVIPPLGSGEYYCGNCWRAEVAGASAFLGAAAGYGGSTVFGAGSWQASTFAGATTIYGQMMSEASAVRNGNMSLGDYAAKYGTEVYNRSAIVADMLAMVRYLGQHNTPLGFNYLNRRTTACSNCDEVDVFGDQQGTFSSANRFPRTSIHYEKMHSTEKDWFKETRVREINKELSITTVRIIEIDFTNRKKASIRGIEKVTMTTPSMDTPRYSDDPIIDQNFQLYIHSALIEWRPRHVIRDFMEFLLEKRDNKDWYEEQPTYLPPYTVSPHH